MKHPRAPHASARRGRKAGALAVATALLSLWLAPAGGAQQPAAQTTEQPEGLFVDRIDVRTVNVEVYVTDRDGEPVRGLEKDDFQLLHDGRPVSITNFYRAEEGASVREGVVEATSQQAETAPVPSERSPEAFGGRAAANDLPLDQQLHMVLYVDNRNMAPVHRTRVFRQLVDFLHDVVGAGDEVMLVSYDGAVKIEEQFSDDVRSLTRRLLDLSEHSGASTGFARDREDILRAIEQAGSTAEVVGRVTSEARSLQSDLRFTVSALRDTIHSLAGLPGRKAVVYVSDGLPLVPGRDLFYAMQNRFADVSALSASMQFDFARSFRQLAHAANSDRVSFITIDASGLELDTGIQAEHRGSSYDNDMRSAVGAMDRSNRQNSIRLLAEQTGGVAIIGSNDVRPRLAAAVSSLRTYYSLGFQPSGAGDGRYHTLEVRVDRPGVVVRHREGYRDKSPATRMEEKVESSLRFDIANDPMGLAVEIGAPVPHQNAGYVLPVTVRIPIGRITLIPRGATYVGKLTLFFSALDPDGKISPVGNAPLALEIPEADYREALGKVWTYEGQLLMRSGRQRLAVAVRDELGGEEAIVGRTVEVDGV